MTQSIDEIIRNAIERGDFDNLKNQGKKLNLDSYFETPEDMRVGYTLLKDANFIPEEATLLKEIATLEEKLPAASPEEARALRKQIEHTRLKYNLLTERFKNKRG